MRISKLGNGCLADAVRMYGIAILCGAALLAAGCSSSARTGWVGLNTHLGEATWTAAGRPSEGTPPACLALVRELDVPLVRDAAMNWGLIQPAPDQACDFSSADHVVRSIQDQGADLLIVFRGVPGWASGKANPSSIEMGPPSRGHIQAFADFVSSFVERYDNDGRDDMPNLAHAVRSYQFMSEMEEIPPAEYALALQVFYKAVKAADPEALVVLGGLRSPGLKMADEPFGDYPVYFERLLESPELTGPAYPYFDVAAFHNFPERYPARPPFDEAVAYMRQTMAAHDLTLPIWLTAYGAGSSPDKLYAQADNLVKWTVKARTIGIQRLYLQCLCDNGDRGHGPVQNCGLVREGENGEIFRKPAFGAFAKLIREVDDRPDVTFRGDGYYVLSGKDSPRYVIWREESYDPAPTLTPGWWSVETLTGPKVVRQGSEVRLTSSPLWVERTTSPFID